MRCLIHCTLAWIRFAYPCPQLYVLDDLILGLHKGLQLITPLRHDVQGRHGGPHPDDHALEPQTVPRRDWVGQRQRERHGEMRGERRGDIKAEIAS